MVIILIPVHFISLNKALVSTCWTLEFYKDRKINIFYSSKEDHQKLKLWKLQAYFPEKFSNLTFSSGFVLGCKMDISAKHMSNHF